MSSIRGRVYRPGGVAADAGATARTEPGPANQPITRPAYRVSQGVMQPQGVGGAGPYGGHALLDFSSIAAWRTWIAVGALLWLGFVWVSFRGGVAGGVRL